MLARLKFNMTFVLTDYISKNEILLIINQHQKEFLKEFNDVLFYFNYKLFVAYNISSLDNMFEIINN